MTQASARFLQWRFRFVLALLFAAFAAAPAVAQVAAQGEAAAQRGGGQGQRGGAAIRLLTKWRRS